MFSFYCLFFFSSFHLTSFRVFEARSLGPKLRREHNRRDFSFDGFPSTICDNESGERSKGAGDDGGSKVMAKRCLPANCYKFYSNRCRLNVTPSTDDSTTTASRTRNQKVFLSISNRSAKTFLRKYLWLRHCSFHFMIQFSVLASLAFCLNLLYLFSFRLLFFQRVKHEPFIGAINCVKARKRNKSGGKIEKRQWKEYKNWGD